MIKRKALPLSLPPARQEDAREYHPRRRQDSASKDVGIRPQSNVAVSNHPNRSSASVRLKDKSGSLSKHSSQRFSLPVLPKASSKRLPSTPITPPPPPPKDCAVSSTPSSTQSPSSRTSSASSLSTSPSSVSSGSVCGHTTPSLPLRDPATSTTLYDPLSHYVPCLYTNCTTHYLLSSLGPTFFSAQAPYALRRKRGLCRAHSCQDLQKANEECKRTYERMRQNAGRKTLREVAKEFEECIRAFDEERETESQQLARVLEKRVRGVRGTNRGEGGESTKKILISKKDKARVSDLDAEEKQEWDWRYSLRPCTSSTCTSRSRYSPFDTKLYTFYHQPRQSGLLSLSTLCPDCALKDVTNAEQMITQKREGLDDEQAVLWMEELRNHRTTEEKLWEAALEMVLLEEEEAREPVIRTSSDSKKGVVDAKAKAEIGNICVVM